jgi:hypothetical protein
MRIVWLGDGQLPLLSLRHERLLLPTYVYLSSRYLLQTVCRPLQVDVMNIYKQDHVPSLRYDQQPLQTWRV